MPRRRTGASETALTIPGGSATAADRPLTAASKLDGTLEVAPKATVRIDRARAAATPLTIQVADDDVLELELDGGIKLWTTLEQFRQDFPGVGVGSAGTRGFTVPTELPLGTPSRGLGAWILKALRVVGVNVSGTVASKIARALEDRLEPGPGLYRCADAGAGKLTRATNDMRTDEPVLLFIHGTASNTLGTFGDLWAAPQQPVTDEIFRRYAGRVYAYEYRTLSQSPIQNAVELLAALPAGSRLHLVTHSCGGLVGELLCRAAIVGNRDPFDSDDRRLFAGKGRAADRRAIVELNRLLETKRPVIESFVRVACPTRGTTLAGARLDRWLSVMVNLLSLAGLENTPGFDLVSDLTLAVVKERTDPKTLPGLEALLPDSPLVRMLNRPDVTVKSDLTVICGDAEGSGLWSKLKLLIPDLFYGEDHDLIVNTRSMYGGAQRSQPGRCFFDQGPEVNHFRYFQNASTTRRLAVALTRPDDCAAAFQSLGPPPRAVARGAVRSEPTPRPVVFVLPGIMGSHLQVKQQRVWLDSAQIALGRMQRLNIAAADVRAEALIESAYGRLVEYLSEPGGQDVIPFPYDWRRSIVDAADRLAAALAAKLDETEKNGQPVRLLAHSMGGLVARMLIAQHPAVWQRLCAHPGGRLIMLGTPNGGTYMIPRLLVHQEGLLELFALAEPAQHRRALLDLIGSYPGLLEMLPSSTQFDFFAADAWRKVWETEHSDDWAAPTRPRLDAARHVRARLDAQALDSERVLYVAGCARATPTDIALDPQQRRIRFLATPRGDGRVSWDTGIPAGVKAWYADVEHGKLAAHEPSFPALLDLLRVGDTTRLPTAPPRLPRDIADRFELPSDAVTVYPDEDDLAAAALGTRRQLPRMNARQRIKTWVAHGNLGATAHAVAVGHYQGDTIVSAEGYLDYRLGGRLRERHALRLYPGALETAAVFLNPGKKPGGAIVIGLGKVGDLSSGELTVTITHGILAYASALAEAAGTQVGGQRITISTLLIGTGAGGMPVNDSVTSILHGVRRAALVLNEAHFDQRVSIEGIELIELWEDRAIQAARGLRRIGKDALLCEWFDADGVIRQVPGGGKRLTYGEDASWWQRLRITAESDGSLRFSQLTDRARAEVTLLPTQRALVDDFITDAVTKTASDQENAKTLFELLMPNAFKEQAPDRRDLLLVVNDEAARYPWELLEDRWSTSGTPLAVEAGLVRQLETDVFRRAVVATMARTALVIGDPQTPFAALPGAEAEAGEVAEILERLGFAVTSRIREDAASIINALHETGYRLLHLAGHGVYEYPVRATTGVCAACGRPLGAPGATAAAATLPQVCPACNAPQPVKTVSGMVIGKDLFLTPGDVEQMRRVPELVFINCCHLARGVGAPDSDRHTHHLLAANIAGQFIRMGVKAVLAAGWAVDDDAARTFALTFYAELLGGVPFGRAVRNARSETYAQHRAVNTWGAYQCYGDPDFRLSTATADTETAPTIILGLPSEAVAEAENIASATATTPPEQFEPLRTRLNVLAGQLPSEWLASATVNAALGHAYGELDLFEPAIQHYQRALAAERADVSLRAIERLANLQCRWAVARAQSGERGDPQPLALIDAAIARLSALLQLGVTVERLALLGGAYRRRALVQRRKDRRSALEQTAAWYERAHQHATHAGGPVDPYPLLNWLHVAWILSLEQPAKLRRVAQLIARWLPRAEAVGAELASRHPGFWNAVPPVDCAVFRHLVAFTLETHVDAIVDAYRTAQTYGATLREFRSVLEHFDFLVEMLRGIKTPVGVRRQVEALQLVRQRLGMLPPGAAHVPHPLK